MSENLPSGRARLRQVSYRKCFPATDVLNNDFLSEGSVSNALKTLACLWLPMLAIESAEVAIPSATASLKMAVIGFLPAIAQAACA